MVDGRDAAPAGVLRGRRLECGPAWPQLTGDGHWVRDHRPEQVSQRVEGDRRGLGAPGPVGRSGLQRVAARPLSQRLNSRSTRRFRILLRS
jgi:hypothetical protein